MKFLNIKPQLQLINLNVIKWNLVTTCFHTQESRTLLSVHVFHWLPLWQITKIIIIERNSLWAQSLKQALQLSIGRQRERGRGQAHVFLKSVFATANIFLSTVGEGYGRIYSDGRETWWAQQKSSKNKRDAACIYGAYGTYYYKKTGDLCMDQQVGVINGQHLCLFVGVM